MTSAQEQILNNANFKNVDKNVNMEQRILEIEIILKFVSFIDGNNDEMNAGCVGKFKLNAAIRRGWLI